MPSFKLAQAYGQLSVKAKLILLMIFVAYSSMLLVTIISYKVGENIINERIDSELTFVTETIMESVDKTIFDRFNDMQLIISDSTLADPNASNEDKTRTLESTLIKLGWYDNIYLTGPDGSILASTNRSSIGRDVSAEAWYLETSKDFIHVSDVVTSPFSNKLSLIFADTLTDNNNNFLGIVFADFSIDVIADVLKNSPDDFEIFLLDKDHSVIAEKSSPNSQNPFSGAIELNNEYYDNFLIKNIISKGYLSYQGYDWELVVQIPKAIAYAPLQRFSLMIWVTLIIISIAVVLLGQFATHRFLLPISKLTEGVGKIEHGNLHTQIEVTNEDEFGYLAKNVNRMTSSLLQQTNKLLEERGKYKSILESSEEAILLYNTSNELIAFNNRFREIFGFSPRMMSRAKDTVQFLYEDSDDQETVSILPKIRDLIHMNDFEKSLHVEITLTKGKFQIIDLYTKPVFADGGELLGRMWIFNDVTEERGAEKSKNDFIQVASHKLRTPITAINWTIQELNSDNFGPLTTEQRQALHDIAKNSGRLNSLVTVLLSSAEIKQNKMTLYPSTFQLDEVIKSVCQHSLNKIPKGKEVDLKITNVSDIANIQVFMDREKIKQVLSILIENACFYGRAGEVNHVSVSTRIDHENKKAIVCVTDNGIGISVEEQSKIFTKFFRGTEAMLQYTEGTGLSLFLAKIIMNSANERIWFESDENKGAKFYISLRLA